jgi:uncharacterized protein YecE (DUF72 family)
VTADSQRDLFGAPPARAARREATVEPAAQPAALATLGASLPPMLRLGTSSWAFPGWRGLVYGGAEQRESKLSRTGLSAYARHPLFRTVGVDRGFYAPVPEETLARYAADVPADFRFLLKAHAALTTPRSAPRPAFLEGVPDLFLDVAHARTAVIEPALRVLGERLGVLLFQFSPLPAAVWRHRAELLARVHDFLRALPAGVRYALEWRNPEILDDDYREMLAAAGALHAPCSHPRMPHVDEQGFTGDAQAALVIRWLLGHGRGYDEARAAFAPFDRLVEPDEPVRERIAALVAEAVRAGRECFVIVNNKAEGSSPLSVERLARRVLRDR